jgi:hypothetical protein
MAKQPKVSAGRVKATRPGRREREKGKDAAEKAARGVAGMSAAERRAHLKRITSDLLKVSPSLEVAESDLLKALLLLGAEFVARYYPDATVATFHVMRYGAAVAPPEYHVMLPMAVPVEAKS